jgi:signal transduction histidine kinase
MTALRRFVDSMTGRIFILLVLSISLSVSLSLALADARQDAHINRSRMEVLVTRARDFIELVNRSPPAVRERLLIEGQPGLRSAPPYMRGYEVDQTFTDLLTSELPKYAKPTARIIEPRMCLAVTGAAGRRDDPAEPIRKNFFDLDCWILTAQTADGMPLRLRFNLPHQADTSPFQDPIPLALSFLAFSLIAFVVARMAAKPLYQLASAATALGDDLDASPLQERGTSEVRAAARAFNAMQQLLRRQMKQRRQMLGAITHDLQTPLTRLRLRIEKVEDEALRQRLIADLSQMQSLIREGLEFARGDETAEPPALLHVDSLLQSLAQDAMDAGHRVVVAECCRCDLTAKPQALRRAVANLLDNAIKYAGPAELGADLGPQGLTIWVRDKGPGLPEDRLQDVLEPFVRIEDSRSRQTGGTGLGLAIANMLAQKNGATLTLRNRLTGGLEASIAFPPDAVAERRPSRRRRKAAAGLETEPGDGLLIAQPPT